MRIFYDVDTQNDFMNKDGALYVPDAELIKPNLKLLTDYARRKNMHIVGSVDRHFGTPEYKGREGELARWGGPFPDHCMNGTKGQWKIDEVKKFFFSPDSRFSDSDWYYPHELDNQLKVDFLEEGLGRLKLPGFAGIRGLYFEKQSYDVFTNPALEVFLDMAEVKQAVVYGVATDFCVKAAVLGMQQRGIQCYVVEDAIKGVFPDKTAEALAEMKKAGARFVTTKQVLEDRLA